MNISIDRISENLRRLASFHFSKQIHWGLFIRF